MYNIKLLPDLITGIQNTDGLQGPYLRHCSFLPPASDSLEYMKFLLWVPNRNGQFYLLFYALVIYFLVRGEGLHMVCIGLFF